MRKILTCLFVYTVICLSSVSVKAQSDCSIDSLRTLYQTQTLHFMHGYIAKGQGGERMPYEELKNEFRNSPDGMIELESYRKTKTLARVLTVVSVSALLFGGSQYNNDKKLSLLLVSGSFMTNYLSLLTGRSARNKLETAVWVRNKDLLFSK